MGPEAIGQYINPEEVVKRLAAAQGIDVLNLVKSMQEREQQQQQAMEQQQEMEVTKQMGQLASSPMMDPVKNAQAEEMQMAAGGPQQQPPEE